MGEVIELARLHDVPEACERLNLSRATVYKLLKSGRLRSVKCGDRRLIPAAALMEFIESLG
jgi:excisionase family DNA binding protein